MIFRILLILHALITGYNLKTLLKYYFCYFCLRLFNSYCLRFLIFAPAISSSIANVRTWQTVEWIETTRLTTFATTALKVIVGTKAIYFVRPVATVRYSIAHIHNVNALRFGCRMCGADDASAAIAIEALTAAIMMTRD